MKLGFETIGNATIIVHDEAPILVTDPWITPDAYFGSWICNYQIPQVQMESILNAKYVWFSHGHPDHLNPDSLPKFKDRKILLADHVGGRIASGLRAEGYDVTVLKDRKWYSLSENVRVLCWSDQYQDSILLIEVKNNLLINCNDAVDFGRNHYIKNLGKKYQNSFLFSISSLGIADMLNYYDENGQFIVPKEYLNRPPAGIENAKKAERFGARYFVPSSSFHAFQRNDSAWANDYSRRMQDLYEGYQSEISQILPAFIRYDFNSESWIEIRPESMPIKIRNCKEFGDDWNEPLHKGDFEQIEKYFKRIEHLGNYLDFINVRVGGVDNRVTWKTRQFQRGITFEVPRNSLMLSIQLGIFEDLLIGNFMKVTLNGKWTTQDLNSDFSIYVGKYADNGLAYSQEQVQRYLSIYQRRFLEFKPYYWIPKLRFQAGAFLKRIQRLEKATEL